MIEFYKNKNNEHIFDEHKEREREREKEDLKRK